MVAQVFPQFGHEADVASVENSYGGEMLNLIDGITEIPFVLRTNQIITKEKKLCAAVGIAKSQTSPNKIGSTTLENIIIDSATYTKEDILSGPIYMPTADYAVAGGKAAVATEQLLGANCMLIPRVHYRLAIKGKGRIPVALVTGIKVGMQILKATGIHIESGTDATVKIDTATDAVDMVLMPPIVGMENEESWQTWSLDFEGWAVNTTPFTTSPLLASLELFPVNPGEGQEAGSEITATYYKITTELTLTEDRHANLREIVEIYTDDSSSTVPAPSYSA